MYKNSKNTEEFFQQIPIKKGIQIIAGIKDVGKTRFCLQLANHVANNNQKVLFVSTNNFIIKFKKHLQKFSNDCNSNLHFDSLDNHDYHFLTTEYVEEFIQSYSCKTIIIDCNETYMFPPLETLQKLAKEKNVCIILTCLLRVKVIDFESTFIQYLRGKHEPSKKTVAKIDDILLWKYANSIYALHRPYLFGQKTNIGKLQIFEIKPKSKTIEIPISYFGIVELVKPF